ncbi:MAG: SIMPL domain-containing protein [Bacteroidaceae bacterium]|nr:SIMPL domain-containing protein [Bacteroidaceae bacterium]
MKNSVNSAIIIALGLIIAGLLVGKGISRFADKDRSVQVRGFSERIVEADKVTWPVHYKALGNDLSALLAEVEKAKEKVLKFLTSNGVPAEDITVTPPKVTDYAVADYKPQNISSRFVVNLTFTVTTTKVDLVRGLTYRTDELVKQGIVIFGNEYGENAIYEYTALDKIKPEMIEASTKNAREAAEQFAKDSGSRLGKIKHASQGYFSIENRDDNTPWMKKVRVVTSVSYDLKD